MPRHGTTHYDPEKWSIVHVSDNGPEVRSMNVPVALALGQHEKLTDEELREQQDDLEAEYERRHGARRF